jgi:hypothetical protein
VKKTKVKQSVARFSAPWFTSGSCFKYGCVFAKIFNYKIFILYYFADNKKVSGPMTDFLLDCCFNAVHKSLKFRESIPREIQVNIF